LCTKRKRCRAFRRVCLPTGSSAKTSWPAELGQRLAQGVGGFRPPATMTVAPGDPPYVCWPTSRRLDRETYVRRVISAGLYDFRDLTSWALGPLSAACGRLCFGSGSHTTWAGNPDWPAAWRRNKRRCAGLCDTQRERLEVFGQPGTSGAKQGKSDINRLAVNRVKSIGLSRRHKRAPNTSSSSFKDGMGAGAKNPLGPHLLGQGDYAVIQRAIRPTGSGL